MTHLPPNTVSATKATQAKATYQSVPFADRRLLVPPFRVPLVFVWLRSSRVGNWMRDEWYRRKEHMRARMTHPLAIIVKGFAVS